MGACRVARVAADGDEVAGTDGKLRRWENQRQRVFARALQQGFVLRGKVLQMTVDTGMTIGMGDIDGIAKAIHIHCQSADVAIGNRKDLLALLIARLDIDAPMEVPGPRLTKVASERYLIVDGTMIF